MIGVEVDIIQVMIGVEVDNIQMNTGSDFGHCLKQILKRTFFDEKVEKI